MACTNLSSLSFSDGSESVSESSTAVLDELRDAINDNIAISESLTGLSSVAALPGDSGAEIKKGETLFPLNFPFPDYLTGYELFLVGNADKPNHYFVRLLSPYGGVVQEFGDMEFEHYPEYRFEDLTTGEDGGGLSVIPYGDTEDERAGYYYAFNVTNEVEATFTEDAVRIPKFDGFIKGTFRALYYTEKKGALNLSRVFYTYLPEFKKLYKYRQCQITVPNGDYRNAEISITNSLEKDKLIYKSTLELDSDMEPINQDYYKTLLFNSPEITDGHKKEAATRAETLKKLNIDELEPVGKYIDEFDELLLEVFFDEASAKGYAIFYTWYYDGSLKKYSTVETFPIEGFKNRSEIYDFNLMTTNQLMEISGYYKYTEYIAGLLKHLQIKDFDELDDSAEGSGYSTLLEENFTYRDDGSLYYHGHSHSAYYYGTDRMGMGETSDKLGRIVTSSAVSIPGGVEEYYNFYADEKATRPAWQLYVLRGDTETTLELNKVKTVTTKKKKKKSS
ncbi:MAG: hypothetical protein K5985_11925 [Lachnospiraceae bacterium]|nr:hypothetical protein [Lachnospiraceae bacterium]